jgi:hypothetical protein
VPKVMLATGFQGLLPYIFVGLPPPPRYEVTGVQMSGGEKGMVLQPEFRRPH